MNNESNQPDYSQRIKSIREIAKSYSKLEDIVYQANNLMENWERSCARELANLNVLESYEDTGKFRDLYSVTPRNTKVFDALIEKWASLCTTPELAESAHHSVFPGTDEVTVFIKIQETLCLEQLRSLKTIPKIFELYESQYSPVNGKARIACMIKMMNLSRGVKTVQKLLGWMPRPMTDAETAPGSYWVTSGWGILKDALNYKRDYLVAKQDKNYSLQQIANEFRLEAMQELDQALARE